MTNSPATDSHPLPFRFTWFYRQADDGDWYHVAPLEDAWRDPYLKSAGVRTAGSAMTGYTLAGGEGLTGGAGARRAPGLGDDLYVVEGAQATAGPILSIRATQAEASLLDPIVAELAALLAQGCEWLDCPTSARFTLSFQDLPAPWVRGDQWGLPTLYLAGRPANDEAREAWERALKLWMVEMLARSRLDDADVRAGAADLRQRLQGLASAERFRPVDEFRIPQRVVYRQWVVRLQAQLGLLEPLPPNVALLTQAVAAGEQHPLETLWQAEIDGVDPDQARLLENEAVVLFDLLGRRVGTPRLFELLPAFLGRYRPADAALFALYDELDREAFTQDWYAYLSRLAGE